MPVGDGDIAPYEPSIEEAFDQYQQERTILDDLSRQELAFLIEYVRSGDAPGAARRVGYSPRMALLASTLLDKPHIRKALRAIRATQRETLRQRQINSAVMALDIVQDIVSDVGTTPETRLKAAMKLIDISGSTAPKEMSDDLRDDAPMERIEGTKMALALKEAEEASKL